MEIKVINQKVSLWTILGALILLGVLIYFGYRTYVYYSCKNNPSIPCREVAPTGVTGKATTCSFWKGKVC